MPVFQPSDKPAPSGQLIGPADPNEHVEISILLKRHDSIDLSQHDDKRAALRAHREDVHADDIAAVLAFASEHDLTVINVDAAQCLVRLGGTVAKMARAFATDLDHYATAGTPAERHVPMFRGRSGAISLPDSLIDIVEAVLGLDNRPIANHRATFRPHDAASPNADSYALPNAIAAAYGFNTLNTNGRGQTIALIELGGGYVSSDISAAFTAMRLPIPHVIAYSVNGAQNQPLPDSGADGEVALDIQVALAAAPGAGLVVAFTPNTDAGFLDAISAMIHDKIHKPSVISISWGSPEAYWTPQAIAAMNAILGDAVGLNVTVFVASGDALATDGISDGQAHVDFPASSPFAIGCGGTRILSVHGGVVLQEVWNDGTSGTGGGISDLIPRPAYQANVVMPKGYNGNTGRGVPDFAANGSPESGYVIWVNGQEQVAGGTSAVAPLLAGACACLNAALNTHTGFWLPKMYADLGHGSAHAVTQGNNIMQNTQIGYPAVAPWAPGVGLGTPNVQAMMKLFAAPIPAGMHHPLPQPAKPVS